MAQVFHDVGHKYLECRCGRWEGDTQAISINYMGISKNSGTPKSSILVGYSIINHPFWGTPIFGNTHIDSKFVLAVFSEETSGCRHRARFWTVEVVVVWHEFQNKHGSF